MAVRKRLLLVLIPWQKIQLPGCFRGSCFDLQKPIYWADVPQGVSLDKKWGIMPLEDDDKNDEYLAEGILENLIEYPKKSVVVFGSSEILLPVYRKIANNEVEASQQISLRMYYDGYKNTKVDRLFMQDSPSENGLILVPAYLKIDAN